MATTISEFRKQKAALEAKIAKEGEKALKAAFGQFLAEHPEVSEVRWTQYTPYFNDGEPCEFGVGEFAYRLAPEVLREREKGDEAGDREDGFLSEWNLTYVKDYDYNTNRPVEVAPEEALPSGRKQLVAALNAFHRAVLEEDVFEAAFGDHARVTATRKGFEVEEYESHD